MSVGQMSAALRNKILVQLEQAVRGKGSQVTQRTLNSHVEYSSRERIRSDTNSKAESVMSRGGLDALKIDMQEYLSKNAISTLGDNIISQLDYDDFKEFLLKKYYTGKVKPAERKEEGYEYTNPIRLTGSNKATKLILATSTEDASKDTIIIKNIAYDKIVVYFKEYIKTKVGGLSTTEAKDLDTYMSSMFNAGHLSGVFTGRLIRAFDLKTSKSGTLTIGGNSDPELQQLFQTVLDLVNAADLLSSNIHNNVELFARSSKQLTKSSAKLQFVTEVQISSSNIATGNLLIQAGNELSKLIKSISPGISPAGKQKAVGDYSKKLLEKLKPVREYVAARSAQLKSQTKISKELERELVKISTSTSTYDLLISTSGSTPVLDHIQHMFAGILDKKQAAKFETSTASVKKVIKPEKTSKKSTPKVSAKALTAKIARATSVYNTQISPMPLANLQLILNSQLQNVVSANMGDGDRRDILNYRSGRLAESVQVERLSRSRTGMITAFYTYMKNPYATFSGGGRQQSPGSRDPKLLIAKSIRDIASQHVSNALRSVNV